MLNTYRLIWIFDILVNMPGILKSFFMI